MEKKFVVILLAFLILSGIAIPALAAEDTAIPYSSAYLDGYFIAMGAKGNGRMVASVSIDGVGVQDKIGILRVDIYKKVNESWIFHDTIDAVDHPEFYAYNSRDYVGDVEFYGTPGIAYYVTVTAVAYKGNGGDTGYITSPTVVCK